MSVADRDGSNAREIFRTAAPGIHSHYPIWSGDGQWIYFVNGVWDAREMDIWRIVRAASRPNASPRSTATSLYRGSRRTHPPLRVARLGRRRVVAVGARFRDQGTRRISSGLEIYSSIDASADGCRLSRWFSIRSPTCGRCPLSIGWRPWKMRSRWRCPRRGRLRHGTAGRRSITCRRAAAATDCGAMRAARRAKCGVAPAGPCSSRRPLHAMVVGSRLFCASRASA